MTDLLDNPIWHALTGRQSQFALGSGSALRFRPDVSPFAACVDESPAALEALAGMLGVGERALLVRRGTVAMPPDTKAVELGVGVQMVAHAFAATPPPAEIVALGEEDAMAMMALATLAEPGPYQARTHELSQFWGVKDERGRLLAMAGERLLLPGMAEVSSVCTHLAARGRGYATLLSRHVASQIVRRGEVPFLHVYAANHAAIALYEKLGFRRHAEVEAVLVERM